MAEKREQIDSLGDFGGSARVLLVNSKPASIRKAQILRPEIQALRAFAVAAVVINHFVPDRLPGGYIGVDVFFVISGFLITGHLRRELDRTGSINLAAFWARRVKRLIPAAMTVLFATLIATAIWIPITAQRAAFEQIGAAGAYILNWLLAANSVDYFLAGASGSPVTHYWTLSVEEQFYFVWPLLMLLATLIARGWARQGQTAAIIAVLSAVFVASFCWALFSALVTPSAAYFESTARAWEFAAGGLLAFIPAARLRNRAPLVVAAWVGWAVLALAAWKFDSSSGLPGPAALVPVLATISLIWVGNVEHPLSPARFTSRRVIQAIGELSYSIYLWHWPIIVLAFYAVGGIVNTRRGSMLIVLMIVTFGLAYLTKRFIEDPIRMSSTSRLANPRIVLAGAAVLVVSLLVTTSFASTQLTARENAVVASLDAQSNDPNECFGAQAALSGATCDDSHVLVDGDSTLISVSNEMKDVSNGTLCFQGRFPEEVERCSSGVPEGTQLTDVALIGDSHARVWAAPLNAVAGQLGLRVHSYLASGCAVTLDPAIEYAAQDDTHPSNLEACGTWRESVLEKVISDPNIDVVITTSKARSYGTINPDDSRRWDEGDGYVGAWTALLAAGKRVVVIDDVPDPPQWIPECISQSLSKDDPCTSSTDIVAGPSPLAAAASQLSDPNFTFLDFQSVFCDDVCHSVIGGVPAYVDSDHLSAPFARSFAPSFLNLPALAAR